MITVYPPLPIAVPTGASLELAGQLQRCADLLEAVLTQLHVANLLLSQLGQARTDDPFTIATDAITFT